MCVWVGVGVDRWVSGLMHNLQTKTDRNIKMSSLFFLKHPVDASTPLRSVLRRMD